MRVNEERLIFFGVLLMILILGVILVYTRFRSNSAPRLEVVPEREHTSR